MAPQILCVCLYLVFVKSHPLYLVAYFTTVQGSIMKKLLKGWTMQALYVTAAYFYTSNFVVF